MSELNIDMTTPEMEELMKKKNDFETLIAKEAEKQRVMISRLDTIHHLHYQLTEANQKLAEAQASNERLMDACHDLLSGWKYIRETYGDLYGVGWDRAQSKAEQALSESPSLNEEQT